MIIKVKGNAQDVTTADNVTLSRYVRVFAAAAQTVTVTTANTELSSTGTFKMPAGGVEVVEKQPTDTITSSGTLSCTPVAIRT
tara:strand:+ start:735 stop:983 length:249 start_codon:yes stop_codon:yes gene_type:complete